MAARVVRLVVVGLELDRHRIEAGGNRLVVAQARCVTATMSKTLTTWVPRLPANSAAPADGVLAGHPTLLVRRGPEREVGETHQAVVRHDAVPGGEDTARGWCACLGPR